MMMDERKELLPKRLARTVIYESPWVNLYRDRVELATGHIIEQYHYLDFGLGAVTAVVENEAGQILMAYIARYHTGTVSWELPAGAIDVGETAIETAEREVREETGYETYDHEEVYSYHPLNGISNMTVHVVRCRAGQGSGVWDENEVQDIRWFSPKEVLGMIGRGEIWDGLALLGLLLHLLDD